MAYASCNPLVFVFQIYFFLLVKCSTSIEGEGDQEIGQFKGLVEGYVYCKSNMFAGRNIPTDATPLAGAIISLSCSGNEDHMVQSMRTGENGHFSISSPKALTESEFHECKVFLPSSPDQKTCSSPHDLNGGSTAAVLEFRRQLLTSDHKTASSKDESTVGPFAFQPSKLKINHKKETVKAVSHDDICDPNCLYCPLNCCFCEFFDGGNGCTCTDD